MCKARFFVECMCNLYEDITPNIEQLKLILQTFFETKLA